MEFGKKKSGLKKYLLPIIIIPTICIAGLSGCQDSSTSTNASVNDAIDNQENEAVKKSLKIVETELRNRHKLIVGHFICIIWINSIYSNK